MKLDCRLRNYRQDNDNSVPTPNPQVTTMTGIVPDQHQLQDHENNHIPLNSNDPSRENISLPLNSNDPSRENIPLPLDSNDPNPRSTSEGENPINDSVHPNILAEANCLVKDTPVSNAATTIATTTSQHENRSPITLTSSVANYESDSGEMEIDDGGGNNRQTLENDGADGDAKEIETSSSTAASAAVGDVTLEHKSDETMHTDEGLSQDKNQSINSSDALKLNDKLVVLAEVVPRAEEEEEMPLQRLVENEGNCKPVLSPPIPVSNVQGTHRDLAPSGAATVRNQKRPIASDTRSTVEHANPNPPIEMPIGTLPQFCIFCPASFKKNEGK